MDGDREADAETTHTSVKPRLSEGQGGVETINAGSPAIAAALYPRKGGETQVRLRDGRACHWTPEAEHVESFPGTSRGRSPGASIMGRHEATGTDA